MAKLTAVSFNRAIEILNEKAAEVPKKVVGEILDKGLVDSTWRETYPDAYTELLTYRKDLEASVRSVLK
ncbi:hypothetical protein LCGC14_0887270 [marine sediment metagenome]|uniref:Uncharacterized protein n=1 Tax=marine sediment metagenome TaxID=412755 RepID=A0A0F9RJN9_9ZZZZ